MKTNHQRSFIEERKTEVGKIRRLIRGWPVKLASVGENTKFVSPKFPQLDPANGHRGRAHAILGAKKFMRTRLRFHENAETQKLMKEME
jgi:hypothetical protein